MAPTYTHSDSDSDGDAPETITLSHSKNSAAKRDSELANARLKAKALEKEKRRLRDRQLKERAAANARTSRPSMAAGKAAPMPGDSDAGDDMGSALEARMARAMADAEEESEAEDGSEADSDVEMAEDDEDDDSNEESESELEGIELNEDKDEDEDDEEIETTRSKSKPKHLPDDFFAAAFSHPPPSKQPSGPAPKASKVKIEQKVKRKTRKQAKDVVLGSRVVRVLGDPSRPPIPRTLPSAKAEKFLRDSLGLKKASAVKAKKGWERRSVNVGILKRDGPAHNFTRSR